MECKFLVHLQNVKTVQKIMPILHPLKPYFDGVAAGGGQRESVLVLVRVMVHLFEVWMMVMDDSVFSWVVM